MSQLAKSYKLDTGEYIDSASIINKDTSNNRKTLKEIINNGDVYSTTEQRIGTWIDGKPLYRKVYDVGNLPNTGNKEISTGFAKGVINPIKIYGMAKVTGSENIYFPLQNIASDNKNDSVLIYETSSSSVIRITTQSNRAIFTGFIVLEYTKTTD